MKRMEPGASVRWVLRLLSGISGIDVHVAGINPLRLRIRAHGGRAVEFNLTYIAVLSFESALTFVGERTYTASSVRPLLATRNLAEVTRRLLRDHSVSWAEQNTGIVHLAAPGLLVDVNAKSSQTEKRSPLEKAKLQGVSGLIAETLIGWLDEVVQLRPLAQKAGVSPALASRILQRLSALRVVEAIGAGPNRHWALIDRGGLLDLWGQEELRSVPCVAPLNVWGRSQSAILAKLPRLEQLTSKWAVGGTSAANLYAPTLTVFPEPTIWVDAAIPIEHVAHALEGERVERGANVYIWQSERNLPLKHLQTIESAIAGPGTVTPIRLVSRPRAYIEALQGSGRSREVAQNLRERILKNESV